MYAEIIGCMYAGFWCMYAETLGCMYAVVGCIYMETVGCMYAVVGCKVCGWWVQSVRMLGSCMRKLLGASRRLLNASLWSGWVHA